MAKKKLSLFGGTVEIIMYDVDESLSDYFFDDIYSEALRLQKIFNFYDSESELSKLNRKRKMKVSDELLFVIYNALKYAKMTNGAYDISLGRQILNRKIGNDIPVMKCSYKDIFLDGNIIILNHPDVLIDLGSIAKGFIGDKIINYMQNLGIQSGFVDARGDLKIYGSHIEIVKIQDPRKNESHYPILFENMAIATSGDYRQYYGSYDKSHILGQKDFISVTVAAETLMIADVAATCIFVLGSKQAEMFMTQNSELKCLATDTQLKVYDYNNFKDLLIKEEKVWKQKPN
jgi:FAD:protein FMN transferase